MTTITTQSFVSRQISVGKSQADAESITLQSLIKKAEILADMQDFLSDLYTIIAPYSNLNVSNLTADTDSERETCHKLESQNKVSYSTFKKKWIDTRKGLSALEYLQLGDSISLPGTKDVGNTAKNKDSDALEYDSNEYNSTYPSNTGKISYRDFGKRNSDGTMNDHGYKVDPATLKSKIESAQTKVTTELSKLTTSIENIDEKKNSVIKDSRQGISDMFSTWTRGTQG